MRSRCASCALASLAALLVGCAGPGGFGPDEPVASAPGRPDHVLLLTVAGLRPEHVFPARAARGGAPPMPALSRMALRGVYADAVESIGVPLAYPAHATLVTGRAPDRHGVVANRLLGKRGVRNAPFWHATRVEGPSLWQTLRARGRSVAAIGWPSTVGASIDLLVPDLSPLRSGETWLGVLEGASSPALLAEMRGALRSPIAAWPSTRERDLAHVAAACAALRAPNDPALVLLRLVELGEVIVREGPGGESLPEVLARTDAHVARLEGCLGPRGAIAVVGDRGLEPVHTRIEPNVALADAGLLQRGGDGEIVSWKAIVRATDSLATVHATSEPGALEARRVLDALAEESGVFRVVAAAELQLRRGDPQAWFGLEAEPGYRFGDGATAPLLRAEPARATGVSRPDAPLVFVAGGAGIRAGVRVPAMTQLDVAPTLAQLLGVELEEAEGRVLVGVLALPGAPDVAAERLP